MRRRGSEHTCMGGPSSTLTPPASMAAMKIKLIQFLVTSLLVHALLVYVAIDIQYTVTGISQRDDIAPKIHALQPPSKRVVIFSIANVSASTVYSVDANGDTNMAFIRRVITSKGRWGIMYARDSHGYLPLFTGSTTDVLIAETNEIESENIFNAVTHSWIWCNSNEFVYFNGLIGQDSAIVYSFNNSINLQARVQKMSEHVEELFLIKGNEKEIEKQLAGDKLIFYFGIDSPQTAQDMVSVDNTIRSVASLFDSYFPDNKTTFILTSVQNISSNTHSMLPFISWGAGVKKPRSKHQSTLIYEDNWSDIWHLDRFERLDLYQTDIVPLISVLLGIRIPIYSLGALPVNYIHYNKEFLAETSYVNSLQLVELVQAYEKSISAQSLPFLFRPFSKLTYNEQEEIKKRIFNLINERKLQEALVMSQKLVKLSQQAIIHYSTYHHLSLKLTITLGVIGWIIYLLTTLICNEDITDQNNNKQWYSLWSIIICIVITILTVYQAMQLHYILYFCFPILCWDKVYCNRHYLSQYIQESMRRQPDRFCINVLRLIIYTVAIELVVFSLYQQHILSVLFLMFSTWPIFMKFDRRDLYTSIFWTTTCLAVAGYIFIGYPYKMSTLTSSLLNVLTGITVVCSISYLLIKPSTRYTITVPSSRYCNSVNAFSMELLKLILAIVLVNIVTSQYTCGFSWCVVLISPLSLLVLPQTVYGRILYIGSVLFTVSYVIYSDVLLIALIFILSFLWLLLEEKDSIDSNSRKTTLSEGLISYSAIETVSLIPEEHEAHQVSVSDVRRATMIGIFIITVFLHCHHDKLIYCVHQEIILLTMKLFLPLIFVTCNYSILSSLLHLSFQRNLVIFTIFCDFLALHYILLMETTVSVAVVSINMCIYVVLGTSVILPFVLLIGQLLTGLAIIPRKREQHIN